MAASPDKKALRRCIRRRRRSLSVDDARRAAAQVAAVLSRLNVFMAARRIAVFLPNDGEIDLGPAMRHHAGKQYYLPVVPSPGRRRMGFAPVGPKTAYRKNRYGIAEPDVPVSALITARQLDLALVPLVAFDRQGRRLGMGGGYYDATFSFLASRSCWFQPGMVGVAFAFQEVPHIAPDPWDIPLSAVVTERGVLAACRST